MQRCAARISRGFIGCFCCWTPRPTAGDSRQVGVIYSLAFFTIDLLPADLSMPSRVTRTNHRLGYREVIFNVKDNAFYVDKTGDAYERIDVPAAALADLPAEITAILGGDGSGYLNQTQTQALIDASIANLVDGAPETLDTLNELAAAINDDASYQTTVSTMIDTAVARADGGYEFTGGFADRLTGQAGANDFGTFVAYTQAMVDDERWLRFGFSSAANVANDQQYWGETDPDYDSTKGLFGGLHMPANVNNLFDFAYDDGANGYSAASNGALKYTAATGSIDFRDCSVGDLALVRFDFNVIPQIANTTVEVAIIWATRNADDDITFTFALTGEPLFYGTGTVGRTFLNRPMLSGYFASAEDVNARALLAIRADNPVQVAPLTTLVTIVR